jgi:hypothetical protein
LSDELSVWVLVRPGPTPPGWLRASAVLLAAAAVLVALTIAAGVAWHDNPARYFGERKFGTYLSFVMLMSAASLSFLIAQRLGSAPSRRFWLLAAGLFAWVACDDLFVFHERADQLVHAMLGWDPNDALTDAGDDLIVGVYGLLAAWQAYRHRQHLLRLRWMVLTMAVAFACFSVMVVVDVMHTSKTIEDALKVAAGTLIVIALLAAYWDPALSAAAARPSPDPARSARRAD